MNLNRSDFILFSSVNSSTTTDIENETLHSTIESIGITHEQLPLFERLAIYIIFIVSLVGLVGNACTIIVLNSRSMRKWRSSILLSALAASDFLYLSIIFLSILDTLTAQAIGLHRSLLLCQTTVYITHVCSFLSANFTLSFTLQRFVAVLFPLHANKIISTRSSTINIFVLILFGCSFYSFSFFLTTISHGVCKEDETYPALFPLLIVDICLTFVFPFILIVIFNCAIVYKLRRRKKFDHLFDGSLTTENNTRHPVSPITTVNRTSAPQPESYYERQQLYQRETKASPKSSVDFPVRSTRKSSDSYLRSSSARLSFPGHSTMITANELTPANSNNSSQNRQTISQRTTKMLVICSTMFLLFNSPYSAVLLYSVISKDVFTRTLGILRYFYFTSFCFNFFLYSLCGHRFRHELILLFKTCFRKCSRDVANFHCRQIEKSPTQTNFTRIPTQAADV